MSLADLRKDLEKIDTKIIELFNERLKIISLVKEAKEEANLATYDPKRESDLVEKYKPLITNPTYHQYYLKFYQTIFEISKAIQITKQFGLIGANISHSLSPKLHNNFFKLKFDNASYQLFPSQEQDLKKMIAGLKNGKYSGFNITAPYKETIIPYLDVMSKSAQEIGAVNVVVFEKGLVKGYNTDWIGFHKTIKNDLQGKSVLLLGTGGAAKAVNYALIKLGANVTVVSRNPDNKDFNKVISYQEALSQTGEMVINATGHDLTDFASQLAVNFKSGYDLSYQDKVPPFLRSFKDRQNGFGFLLWQAIKSYEIFTNQKLTSAELKSLFKERFYE
ncbi:MAG: chorismate mutase [Erysipelotrichales bacterium]|nr:chorismate mutase [Erysipelotrichales bacterium]